MLDLDLPELEQEFRHAWRAYDPSTYEAYLSRTNAESRSELLVRLLSAELEYYYQPPTITEDGAKAADADEFELDADKRVSPRVQLFVLRFAELKRNPEVIVRLIVLEFALRLKHDQAPPNIDSYLELCPTARQDHLVKLLELTENKLLRTREAQVSERLEANKNDSTVKESSASISITLDPLPYNLGCFLLIRMIGRGGMGYVHAAIDLRSTAQVAVKLMRRTDAWSVYRFTEEFSWLSQLNHPNLVRLYDAFSEGDLRYFSMELVEGRTIREWFAKIRSTAPMEASWNRLRGVMAQLASAIQFLHLSGVIHRDIKCSNVMITPRRRAVLLDLGLAVRSGQGEPGPVSLDGDKLIGTLQYIAPEGLAGKPLSCASDWFSFGIMFYEVITNEYPSIKIDLSVEDDGQKFVLNKTELFEKLSGVPTDVAELCVELLNSDPAGRPLGASVVQRLGGSTALHVDRELSTEIAGREKLLAKLNQRLLELGNGVSSLVVVRGELGIGKTALVQAWVTQLVQSNMFLLNLRCYHQDHTPLRLLNSLVQELVRTLAGNSEETWREAVGTYAKAISRTFPQIQQLQPRQSAPSNAGEFDAESSVARRDASQQALASLLTLLSCRKPIVIVVDDAQWSDQQSLIALPQMLANPEFQGLLLLVESEDRNSVVEQMLSSTGVELKHVLFELIDLEPLQEVVCGRLLANWAVQSGTLLSSEIRRDLVCRSAGNPFLLQEFFRAYLHFTTSEDYSDEEWMETDPQENALRRFRQLSVQAESVVHYLAVADQPIGFHQLQMVSRIPPDELQRTLSYLSSQGWIRIRGMNLDSGVELAHESFRKIFIDSLTQERLHRRHYRLARILSGETPPPWSRIAFHYWSAERFREAAACYIEAARLAARASAFEDALFFLERAMHPEADRSKLEQVQALQLKASCLAGRGSSNAAATLFEEIGEQSKGAAEANLVECLAGEQWIRAGQLDKGLALLRSALMESGVTLGKPQRFARLRLLWRAYQAKRRPLIKFADLETSTLRNLSVLEQSLNRISAPMTFLDNQLGPDIILRLDDMAADHGSPVDYACASARTGILLSFGGARWRRQAMARIRNALQITRRTGLASAKAPTYFCMFVWYAQRGLQNRAARYGTKAITFYLKAQPNTRWEIQFLHWGILSCLWNANRLRELGELKNRHRESAHKRSDPMSSFWMNVSATVSSDLAQGNIERASQAVEIAQKAIANQSFQSPRFYLWLSKVQIALYEGNWRQAQSTLASDWKKLSDSWVLNSNHYLWLALGSRLCADLCGHRECPEEKKWLRHAQKTVRRMLSLEERVFVCCGRAGKLVVDAARGHIAPQEQWHSIVRQLHTHGHHLLAHALQWHQSQYAKLPDKVKLRSEVEQALQAQGVVAPRRLLDIVLPLPGQ